MTPPTTQTGIKKEYRIKKTIFVRTKAYSYKQAKKEVEDWIESKLRIHEEWSFIGCKEYNYSK